MLLLAGLLRRARQALRARLPACAAPLRRAILPLAAALAPGGSAAVAQSASQITPPSFRPAPAQSAGAVVFSGRAGLDAPTGADRLTVRIARLLVDGPFPELAAEHSALETRLVRRPISAAEIFGAARDLEAAYARAGYVLVRVVLPAQTLRDGGQLRLAVVDGFIERVEVEEVPEAVRERVAALLAPLAGRCGLRLGEIERRLLLAGDLPGIALRSSLVPGSETGGATLVVQARYRAVTGFAGVDNTLASALGGGQASAGLDLNGGLRAGETVYVRGSGHPGLAGASVGRDLFGDRPRARTIAAGVVVPVGLDGFTLNLEGTESRTTPRPAGPLRTGSVFERLSARLRYPVVRSRALTVGTEAIFDAQTEDFSILLPDGSLPLSSDRLRIWRLAGDLSMRISESGVLAARAIASFGLDGLGARSAADANSFNPLSRAGADARFEKADILVSLTQPVADHLVFAAYARAQTSFGAPLPRSEQIGIASFSELSTFDAGTLGGDSGWIVRGEVSSPWSLPSLGPGVTATPYAFAGTGALSLAQPTAVEQGTTAVSSYGIGLRLAAVFDPAFSDAFLAVEFGRRVRDDDEPNENRFTLVGAIRF